ncbi:MAG: right-handed parallel beta-helix repeat-containing protein [Myxococcales bacterium]|nr:right-handed parallel beta-helix repeat-containing protein [Myxococcota bacterium]MDW8283749.1 right-handed parallel beta-helix repeat-containing protein [Myxococcales bacterium]
MKTTTGPLSFGLALAILSAASPALAVVCNVPSMAHPTIQSAANDMACTEIVIAAGVYVEQVTVGRVGSIFVHGAGAGRTIIRSPPMRVPSTFPTPFHPNYTYIVQVPPGTAADFADLTIDGTGNSYCGEPLFGIRFNNANGSLDRVVVENVRSPGADLGCQNTISVAITGDPGGGAVVSVLRSTVRNFQKVGVLVNGPTAAGGVFNTVIRGVGATPYTAQNGIQFSRGAAGSAQDNIIVDVHYTGDTCLLGDTQVASGIITYQAGPVTLVGNYISGADRAILLRENVGAQVVTLNRLVNNFGGIFSQLNGMGLVRISDNRITGTVRSNAGNVDMCFPDSGNALSVRQESGTALVLNHVADSARNGIELFPGATSTEVQQNRVVRGTRADLEDRGMGSSVTQNTCRTSIPPGLCAFAP